jgi:hypothetical protein
MLTYRPCEVTLCMLWIMGNTKTPRSHTICDAVGQLILHRIYIHIHCTHRYNDWKSYLRLPTPDQLLSRKNYDFLPQYSLFILTRTTHFLWWPMSRTQGQLKRSWKSVGRRCLVRSVCLTFGPKKRELCGTIWWKRKLRTPPPLPAVI